MKNKWFNLLALPCLMFLHSQNSLAVETPAVNMESGDKTIAVLELYTSEGCSSCPPAEQFLKKITANQDPNATFIPLSFHVDYWDYIGWEDPFADPDFGKRQRGIAIRNQLNTLYTPQFVFHGKDFRASHNIPEAAGIINNIKPLAKIKINAKLDTKKQLDTNIIVSAQSERSQWYSNIYIAIVENNLTSNITDGENNGLRMQHENVVRKFIGPFPLNGKEKLELNKNIAIEKDWDIKNLNLVVFAQDSFSGVTHQALQVALGKLAP